MVSLDAWRSHNADAVQPSYREATNPASGLARQHRDRYSIYYTSSTYYGHANVLSLGFAGMYQRDGVGTSANPGDYKAWNVDGLMERKLGKGAAVTLECAYYQYRTGGKIDVGPSFGGAGATDNVGGLRAGNAGLVSVSYLFGQRVGVGQFQPTLRYQQFDPILTGGHDRQYDGALNYIIKGHNARISLDYAHVDYASGAKADRGVLGLQVQI